MAEKMKVRALQGIVGPEINLRPGDEHEGDATEMARWCEAGVAEPLKATRRRAVKPKAETAVTD